jgi:AcrR family transcriptional regulator/DNA-binding MarR family transcriptional regulator
VAAVSAMARDVAVSGVDNAAPAGVGRMRVGEIQRARILAAMGELVRERGAGGVTVAHVVARSGVSRRTFYELFADREDCFLAAFDAAIARAAESVVPAYAAPKKWRERIRMGLEAALRFLDSEPELGFLCVVGALGGGELALERRTRVVAALVDVVHEGRLEGRGIRRPGHLVAEGVVGAVLAVIHARLVQQSSRRAAASGRSARPLLGLLNPLMGMIVLPYLGAGACEREQKRPAPKARRPAAPRGNPLRELDMRLTYRTVRALLAIASRPASSNREVATAAGISDQGQISKLLARLQSLGLIENTAGDHAKGEPNAWALTVRGREVTRTLQTQTSS